MFVFFKLYAAHLIADFVFQFDELYALKVKSRLGHFFHVLIHFIFYIIFLFPYLSYPSILGCILFVTVIHYYQDNIKYKLQIDSRKSFYCFTIDQIVHVGVVAVVLLFPVSHTPLGFPNNAALNSIYLENLWTHLLSLFIWITFGGSYLLHNFRKTFGSPSRSDQSISTYELTHAIFERGLWMYVFLVPPTIFCVLTSPLIGLLRLASPRLRSKLDFGFSFLWTALLVFLFKLWI